MRLMSDGKRRPRRAGARARVDEDGALLLALGDGDERLPWLEEDEDEDPGLDTRRLAVFLLASALLIAALAGGAWWLWHRAAAPELVADGSVIEAPDGPYKLRPADRGGREVTGTGATSFAIAEGRPVEGRIAPGPMRAAAAEGEGAPAQPTPSGVAAVQIGAYATRAEAQAGWTQLHARLEPLHGRPHRILEGTADSGAVYRLQVVTESPAAASELCRTLREAGGDCQVKR